MKSVKSFSEGETLFSEYLPDINLERKDSQSKASSKLDISDIPELNSEKPSEKLEVKQINLISNNKLSDKMKVLEQQQSTIQANAAKILISKRESSQVPDEFKNSDIQALYKKLKVQVQ